MNNSASTICDLKGHSSYPRMNSRGKKVRIAVRGMGSDVREKPVMSSASTSGADCCQGTFHPNRSLFQLRHLQWIDLAFNDNILSAFVAFFRLISLTIMEGNLNLKQPAAVFDMLVRNLTRLQVLHLDEISISLVVPKSLMNSSSLTSLHLDDYQLPPVLDLSFTNFYGELPNSIGNLKSLRQLSIAGCEFSGSFQVLLGILQFLLLWISLEIILLAKSLFHFLIFTISLSRPLSKELIVLKLSKNSFHGTIPQTFTDGSALKTLYLFHNRLHGPVPRTLAKCTMLEVLDLINNMISYTFPFWLETLPELKILILRPNRFHGPIGRPKGSPAFPKLNNFTVTLPSEYIENWKSMMIVDDKKSELKYMGNGGYYFNSVTVMNK
ncbi:hypothetical protein Acr_29g0005930 [Actinidia rufa]|uniref:Uncharacterized protein n=1 Tax=Actinidia rufa TaxID=165716 RepID=A0A7J0HEP6_9ERIC|nr:hypothetical protein Acr_29g0005930 [Actinidia rufa]